MQVRFRRWQLLYGDESDRNCEGRTQQHWLMTQTSPECRITARVGQGEDDGNYVEFTIFATSVADVKNVKRLYNARRHVKNVLLRSAASGRDEMSDGLSKGYESREPTNL